MTKAVLHEDTPTEGHASFGAGLGADFKPHTKRIIIGLGRDQTRLKVKKTGQGENSEAD
ncbi:hypothetical protein J2W42_000933 [Rhizobium tibeticum]|uniref:hypothetical protein n=1 Tax=Rhizobium tibeticum TaxID=501024 RepID=UPI0027812B8B|nr:hypothetical protein [Rhizobium tibeticum]MDP9808095.1 hypothetical protein [Rhizobium tibeticum]